MEKRKNYGTQKQRQGIRIFTSIDEIVHLYFDERLTLKEVGEIDRRISRHDTKSVMDSRVEVPNQRTIETPME